MRAKPQRQKIIDEAETIEMKAEYSLTALTPNLIAQGLLGNTIESITIILSVPDSANRQGFNVIIFPSKRGKNLRQQNATNHPFI